MTDTDTDTATARRCHRAEHCGNAASGPDGTLLGAWAEPGTPYCHRCTQAITRTLTAMPARYAWLRWHIGRKPVTGQADPVTGTREAPMVIRLDIDALIRDMTGVLGSWDERVADACGLDRPATAISRARRDEVAIPAACAALAVRVPALVALPAEPMTRTMTLRRGMRFPEGATGWVHRTAGFVRVYLDLSGADAGREILGLAWMSRRLLGETIPPPARLDGVPCKGCDVLALVECWDHAYRSECEACGDLLTAGEYLEWVRMYSRLARQWVEEGTVVPVDRHGYSHMAA
jgi:hypothetical protein